MRYPEKPPACRNRRLPFTAGLTDAACRRSFAGCGFSSRVKAVEEKAEDGMAGNRTLKDDTAGKLAIALDRSLSGRTGKALARQKETGAEEKTVYVYDLALKMDLARKDGKRYETRARTDAMYVGHEDSGERKTGAAPERFDFPFFNNMAFHTEFVRRFYRQMLFGALQELDKEKAFSDEA